MIEYSYRAIAILFFLCFFFGGVIGNKVIMQAGAVGLAVWCSVVTGIKDSVGDGLVVAACFILTPFFAYLFFYVARAFVLRRVELNHGEPGVERKFAPLSVYRFIFCGSDK